jgi:DNA-binding response OmpR family regulator
MLDENDIVTAILNSPAAQEALRSIARIAIREVALRSNTALPVEDTTVIGKMTIDRLRRTVTVKGQVRPIKPREFALLETLARRPGIVFSRERCITLAWPDDTDAIDRTVDVHVARLRRIFGRDTLNIRTVPGVGYAIEPPADE